MSIIMDLTKEVENIINKAGYEVDNFILMPSGRRDLGQYQINDAMNLAKKYHKSPIYIATRIKEELEKEDKFININIAGPGFINITLSNDFLIASLNKIATDKSNNIDKENPKKIILDYGGANVSKALHVGHLRSANIGEALKRTARLLGHEVIGDAHLGDYGRPLGLVILEIKKRYPNLAYFDENYTGDYNEIELPITNSDLEQIYPLASLKAKEDEIYLEEAREITLKIQSHERGYYDLWKKVVDISKEAIKKVYESLDVYYDLWQGESDAVAYLDELTEKFEQENILINSNGAKIVEVKNDEDTAPMPPLLFTKSNGTISYETTDLATILQRRKEYNPDEIWYCVDNRQSLHFEQVFRAARMAKLVDSNVNLEFIGFGTMNGKDGKPFKTRDGGIMTLEGLIDLVKDETLKKITNESIKNEEKEEVAMKVAIAALKYTDLLPFRGTDYIFDIDKFADLEGKTGPYLLYSTIRMKSLLKKASDENINYQTIKEFKTQTEEDLSLLVFRLPTILKKALETKSLNDIAEYLYLVTSTYNKFYSENRILTEKNANLKESWLVLTKIVYDINTMLLDILGIKVPEKM